MFVQRDRRNVGGRNDYARLNRVYLAARSIHTPPFVSMLDFLSSMHRSRTWKACGCIHTCGCICVRAATYEVWYNTINAPSERGISPTQAWRIRSDEASFFFRRNTMGAMCLASFPDEYVRCVRYSPDFEWLLR